MRKIHQLTDLLANQIAAGEVVERPASVVKELIENSVDANSTTIKIMIKEAGLKEITVIDNGEGIEREDIKHAFLRHATSKIKYEQDLFHIKSLGFRGEALASIAAVSMLTIKSSNGREAGTKLCLEAGKILKEEKSDARRGTEITVSDLFFNTPARLKYIKSLYTELGHITDLVNRYAMACPQVRFELIHNDKQLFFTPGNGQLLQVIQQVYGTAITQQMISVQAQSLDFKLSGYIAKPSQTRANRRYMTFIVNGRYVKSNALIHAVLRGYNKLLMVHRYPISVISIELDPVLTDVNVHPTKLEIRFSKEKELTQLIEQTISDHLKRINLIPQIERTEKQKLNTTQSTLTFDNKQSDHAYGFVKEQTQSAQSGHSNRESPLFEQKDEKNQINTTTDKNKPLDNDFKDRNNLKDREHSLPSLFPIGQLHGTYILAQNHEGFYMIDQHAAQERIKYEFYRDKIANVDNNMQSLLMPLSFDFTDNEIIYIEKHRSELENIGIFLDHFGGKTYAVRAYPSWFPQGQEADIIHDIIDQIIKDNKPDIKLLREEAAILMSCKKSIKANHYLTLEDMERLLQKLSETEAPYTCPHGRPVIIQFSNYEIEKMFKRIQD